MINPSNIRAQSRSRKALRFWVLILLQIAIVLAAILVLIWFSHHLDPNPSRNIQLPTLTTN